MCKFITIAWSCHDNSLFSQSWENLESVHSVYYHQVIVRCQNSVNQLTLNKSERRVPKRSSSSRSSSIKFSNTGEGNPRVQPKRSAGREATTTDSNGAHTLPSPHSNLRPEASSPPSWPELENSLCSSQLLSPLVGSQECFRDESSIDSS